MKYKITIEQITERTRTTEKRRALYSDDAYIQLRREDSELKQYEYVDVDEDYESKEQVYEQTKDGEIDLMAVISAFNGVNERVTISGGDAPLQMFDPNKKLV